MQQTASIARSPRDFPGEILDLRGEIMTYGALIPLFALAAAAGLTTRPPLDGPNLPRTLCIVAALALSVGCAWLNQARPRAAMAMCSAGVAAIAALAFAGGLDSHTGIGLAYAGALAALLLGPAFGWAAWAFGAAVVALSAFSLSPAAVWPGRALAIVVVGGLLVLLAQVAARALFRALRWMQDNYELAQERAAALSEQSAELALALKSLSQTSFQLARANEQLAIAMQYAEDARQSKQQFAASVSHELRAPLNLIIGFSDLILRDPAVYQSGGSLPPKLLADIHVIHRHAEHLQRLVNDILDLSQMDVNYLTVSREPVDIEPLIQSAVSDYAPLVEQRGLALAVDLPPGLPPAEADATRVRQVLLNLLNNALRFTDQGGITVKAGLADDRAAIVISVADTGVGIAPEDAQRIFEPFVRVGDPERYQSAGSGLGLTISRRFVELHGGRMWVESALGTGSIFRFTLPIAREQPAIQAQRARRDLRRREVGALAVVERSPSLSRLLERHLAGIRVVSARSVEELADSAEGVEMLMLNEPAGATLPAPPLPEPLRGAPVLRCFVPGAFGTSDPPTDGEAGPRQLSKPVRHEDLEAALADMLGERRRRLEHPDDAPRRPARVLVVEDDEDALYLLGRMLSLAPANALAGYNGLRMIKARSGDQALAVLEMRGQPGEEAEEEVAQVTAGPVDAVLLDLSLGAVSGFDVLAEMARRPDWRAIPVCIVSGRIASGDALATPYISLERRGGFTARELAQAAAALGRIALPGLELSAAG
jgi:signal transduction histidine kinase/CheY-like chemotaxis protein